MLLCLITSFSNIGRYFGADPCLFCLLTCFRHWPGYDRGGASMPWDARGSELLLRRLLGIQMFFLSRLLLKFGLFPWKQPLLVELGFVLAGDDQHPVMLLAGGEWGRCSRNRLSPSRARHLAVARHKEHLVARHEEHLVAWQTSADSLQWSLLTGKDVACFFFIPCSWD